LYEERLSTAEARRYEMEDLIGSLREQLRSQAQSPSPTSAARQLSSATQIENEALREQVVHLQKKLTITEDMLEEVHATAERDEAVVRDRIRRFKEKEDVLKQQVAECESEIARLDKSENNARIRTEEVGEALRESTVALENARAEIEGLRAEIVVRKHIIPESMIIDASQDLEGVVGLSSTDSVDQSSEPTPRSTHGHMHYIEEIARLKGQLAEATEALHGTDNDRISASLSQLQKTIDELVIEKTNVRYACAPLPTQLRVFLA
jgi:CAP-Gly domain-containing linker protein 1